jgi:hypothetical protein
VLVLKLGDAYAREKGWFLVSFSGYFIFSVYNAKLPGVYVGCKT